MENAAPGRVVRFSPFSPRGKCSARIEAVSNHGKFNQTGRKIKQI
jgi:hypothetical protein